MDKLFQKVGSRTRKGRKNGRIYEMCLLFASYFLWSLIQGLFESLICDYSIWIGKLMADEL